MVQIHSHIGIVILLALGIRGTSSAIRNNTAQLLEEKLELLKWRAPEKIQVDYPYYLSGYDYDGKPVIVLQWGKWNPTEIIEAGGKDFEDFDRRSDQFVERIRARYFTKAANQSEYDSNDDEVAVIVDFDGFDMRQFSSQKTLVYMMSYFGKLESCYEKFAYGFIVNASTLADQIIYLAKAFMGKFLERTQIYGTNAQKYIPQILKKIPKSQLDPAYGGEEGFQPVAFYG